MAATAVKVTPCRDGGNGGSGGSGGAVGATGTVAVISSSVTGSTSGAGGIGGSGGWLASDGVSGFPGNGGGISTGSSVTASSSTFSGCYATYGGAVDAGSANADSSVFTGCSAFLNGGAVYANSVMITSTTLTGCNAFLGDGGAVSAGSGTIRFSRLVNNNGMVWIPVTHDGDDITGSVDARYNWWGANSIVSSRVTEGVEYSPNLILTATATPPAMGKSKSSLIEANLTIDSAGTWHDPASGHVPDGIPVTFAVASGPGLVSPGSAVTSAGVAQTTFTSPAVGTTTVTVTVDGQQALVSILVDPEARFTVADRSVVRQQQEAEFIDQSVSTLPLTYLWDFGDGTTETNQNPDHVYKKEGVYNITLDSHERNRERFTHKTGVCLCDLS